jgi:hypothetical protein
MQHLRFRVSYDVQLQAGANSAHPTEQVVSANDKTLDSAITHTYIVF